MLTDGADTEAGELQHLHILQSMPFLRGEKLHLTQRDGRVELLPKLDVHDGPLWVVWL